MTVSALRRLLLAVAILSAPAGFAQEGVPDAAPDGTQPLPPPLLRPQRGELAVARIEPLSSHRLPVGPFAGGRVPVIELEGRIDRRAWRTPEEAGQGGAGQGTLSLLAPLRDRLVALGFTPLYSCEARDCGGFDFRYRGFLLPEPDMHVDLGDYRYLAARRGEGAAAEYLELWVSRSDAAGYVQVTAITPAGAEEPDATDASPGAGADRPSTPPDTGAAGFAAALEDRGAVPLDDLVFASGASGLAEGAFASLAALAAYLDAHPDRSVTLVGHTDATGGLSANIALSRARAEAVVERLVDSYGVPRARLSAEGAGWLAPRASNLTDEGRARNRRVEAMLTSTQ
ncbi:OmpA family protein [Frigidibacter oleivorans]|uniref:OmpA family protein n=1 Tax=Frigidibacter oleivorans TaxID=2487129 RepID=UPI000F8CA347|nr:OmpA family protein [Frigidibacter oleivorans]